MQKTCQNCKNSFVLEPADLALLEKLQVPQPTFCPSCRMQRRMAFRNDATVFRAHCSLCQNEIISMYPDNTKYKVYCRDCWNSDKWDALEYGRDYDFSKSFFQQVKELLEVAPRRTAYIVGDNENSDFANFLVNSKDVYMSTSVLFSEAVFFSRAIDNCKDICDSFNINHCENCYELVDCGKCYNCSYSLSAYDCLDSSFLYDCVSCQNCFMSSNLRKKQYVFRNKQLSQEAYEEELKKIDFGDPLVARKLQQEFARLQKSALHQFSSLRNVVNVTGSSVENAKDSSYLFDSNEIENVHHALRIVQGKDSMDWQNGGGELVYEAISTTLGVYKQKFSAGCNGSNETEYSQWCESSENIFGCVALRKEEYCILNKKYSPEEYELLRKKIIEQMHQVPYKDAMGRMYGYGEFFPIELSDYAYNQLSANDYYPLTKEQALSEGYKWQDDAPSVYKATMSASQLPKTSEATDAVLREVIECEKDGSVYKIIKKELDFLRAKNLPLPRMCPKCRHKERFKKRLPLNLWNRTCMCQGKKDSRNKTEHAHHEDVCPNEFMTPYAPNRPESVYCDDCYTSEVV